MRDSVWTWWVKPPPGTAIWYWHQKTRRLTKVFHPYWINQGAWQGLAVPEDVQ